MPQSSSKFESSPGSDRNKQQGRGMGDHKPSHVSLEDKAKARGRRYPVSTRAYNRKDYEYLSNFPRAAASVALKASAFHEDVGVSREPSDGDSDFCTTSSSVDYATSLSSACSTSSSSQSCGKSDASLIDMESNHQHKSHSRHEPHHLNHPHRQGQQHHRKGHHDDDRQECCESSTLSSSLESMENPGLQKGNEEKPGNDSKPESKAIEVDSPNPTEADSRESKGALIKVPSKVKSRHVDAPAVLPKFGSWDTRNPVSGEAYTLIFKKLRDEKKAGTIAVCESPTHPEAEEADIPLGVEIKTKEPLFPDSPARTARMDTVQGRKRWILCCKASVLGD